MNLNNENIKKIMFIIAFALVFAVCIFNLGTVFFYINILFAVITPFLAGGAMAFVVNIPMKIAEEIFFENKYVSKIKVLYKLKRPLSLIFALLFIIGIIGIVVGIVLPELYSTILSISKNISDFLPKLYDFVKKNADNQIIEKYIYQLQQINWLSMLTDFLNVFTSGAGSVISSTLNVIGSIMSTTFDFLIAFIFCIYVLAQKETLSNHLKIVLKAYLKDNHYKNIVYVAQLTNKTFSSYITGQCLDAFILGVMFFIVLLIAGMPYPMLIGVLIGFTALIPMVGAFIGCIISVLLIFMISPAQSIIFLIIFIILQQVEENLIYPKVVGSSVGLPSIWVIVAVSVGGSLWGVIGMIICIPLFSVMYTLFKDHTKRLLLKKQAKHNI